MKILPENRSSRRCADGRLLRAMLHQAPASGVLAELKNCPRSRLLNERAAQIDASACLKVGKRLFFTDDAIVAGLASGQRLLRKYLVFLLDHWRRLCVI